MAASAATAVPQALGTALVCRPRPGSPRRQARQAVERRAHPPAARHPRQRRPPDRAPLSPVSHPLAGPRPQRLGPGCHPPLQRTSGRPRAPRTRLPRVAESATASAPQPTRSPCAHVAGSARDAPRQPAPVAQWIAGAGGWTAHPCHPRHAPGLHSAHNQPGRHAGTPVTRPCRLPPHCAARQRWPSRTAPLPCDHAVPAAVSCGKREQQE